jgi:hypothetical protein
VLTCAWVCRPSAGGWTTGCSCRHFRSFWHDTDRESNIVAGEVAVPLEYNFPGFQSDGPLSLHAVGLLWLETSLTARHFGPFRLFVQKPNTLR